MQSGTSISSQESREVGLAGQSGSDGAAQPKLSRAGAPRDFDGDSERDWCELVRNIAAIANSGGGVLVLQRSPRANQFSATDITRRLAHFTDADFTDITLEAAAGTEHQTIRIKIGSAEFPIVFNCPGSIIDANDTTKRIDLFAAGSLYFWNGENSEPASSRSLQLFLERLLRRVRRRWLAGIRRVLNQPVAALVRSPQSKLSKRATQAARANLQPVRIVTDPAAPALQPQDVDRLYPLRQKELVAELNRRLGRRALNSYDIQAVRRHHRLDVRPDFVFHLPGAGRRYSPAVLEWIMDQYGRDAEFFHRARAADSEALKLRRQKPR